MRACPFCSGEEIKLVSYIKTRTPVELEQKKPQESEAFYKCQHCAAEGSHFIGTPIEVLALAAWEGDLK
jgi:hypothetical protein